MALRPNVGHGFLIHEVSRSHITTHHSRSGSSGRVISSSQRPLLDNTQHSQQTDIHAPPRAGFEPTISAGERTQTYALDRAATGIGILLHYWCIYFVCSWKQICFLYWKWIPKFVRVLSVSVSLKQRYCHITACTVDVSDCTSAHRELRSITGAK